MPTRRARSAVQQIALIFTALFFFLTFVSPPFPWWFAVGVVAWCIASVFAELHLRTGQGRKTAKDSLLEPQLYRRWLKWVLDKLLSKFTPQVPDQVGLWGTLRVSLNSALLDRALLIAVAYPVLALLGFWVFGQPGRLGDVTVLPQGPRWDRVLVAGYLVLIALASIRESTKWLNFIRWNNRWSLVLVFCLVTLAFALFTEYPGADAVAFAFAGAIPAIYRRLASRGYLGLFWRLYVLFCMALLLAMVWALARFGSWSEVDEQARGLFIFLGVLPFINGLFDWVSYGVTFGFLKRGMAKGGAWPFLFGILDLAFALMAFFALGLALGGSILALNWLAGAEIFSLAALIDGIRNTPEAYGWVYLMLFSTLLPTVLHFCLALVSCQAWLAHVPRLRTLTERCIDTAQNSTLSALGAALLVGGLWVLIPWLAVGAGALLLHFGWDMLTGVGGAYLAFFEARFVR